jgi:hypothetical protein
MTDVQSWVKTQGAHLLFVYGELDPWGAGAYDLGGAADSFKFYVAGGNHGSTIMQLAQADRDVAVAAIGRWANVTPVVPLPLHKAVRDWELDLELSLRSRRR